MSTDQSKRDKNSTRKVNIDRARLIEFRKKLEEMNAHITVEDRSSGELQKFEYGPKSDDGSLPHRDLFNLMWPDATDDAINRIFMDGYDLDERHSDYKQVDPAHYRYIEDIKATFVHKNNGVEGRKKEKFYFKETTDHLQSIKEIYPGITQRIVNEIAQVFKSKEASPRILEVIQGLTRFNGMRDDVLDKLVLRHLYKLQQQDEQERLTTLSQRLGFMINDYIKTHQENSARPHYQNSYLLPDQEDFSNLFVLEAEDNNSSSYFDKHLDTSEFPEAFENRSFWFQGNRYQILHNYRERLIELPVEQWPLNFISHTLFALLEYTSIKKVLRAIVREEMDNIAYRVDYTKNKREITLTDKVHSLESLFEHLSAYKMVDGAIADNLKRDGNLLNTSLKRLPIGDQIENPIDTNAFVKQTEPMIKQFLVNKLADHSGFKGEFNTY